MGSHVTIGPSIQPLHVSWCQVSPLPSDADNAEAELQ